MPTNPTTVNPNPSKSFAQPKEERLRIIPKTFERESRFTHELVWRDGPFAIYRYHYHGGKPNPHPKWKFEAVIIRIKSPHPKSSDARYVERLPGNSDWGLYGWSLNTLEAAKNQIEEVRELRGEKIESRYRSDLKSLGIYFRSVTDLKGNTILPTGKGGELPSADPIREEVLFLNR